MHAVINKQRVAGKSPWPTILLLNKFKKIKICKKPAIQGVTSPKNCVLNSLFEKNRELFSTTPCVVS